MDADKLDIDKLQTAPFDLRKLSTFVKNDVAKRTVYHQLVKRANAILTIDNKDLVKEMITMQELITIKDIEDEIPKHDNYITTYDFNKFSGTIFDERLKRAKLATYDDLDTVSNNVLSEIRKKEKNCKRLI